MPSSVETLPPLQPKNDPKAVGIYVGGFFSILEVVLWFCSFFAEILTDPSSFDIMQLL